MDLFFLLWIRALFFFFCVCLSYVSILALSVFSIDVVNCLLCMFCRLYLLVHYPLELCFHRRWYGMLHSLDILFQVDVIAFLNFR